MVKIIKAILRVAALAFAIAAASVIAQAQTPGKVKFSITPRPPITTMVDTTAPKILTGQPYLIEFKQPEFFEQWWQQLASCEDINLPPEHAKTRFYLVNTADLRLKGDTTALYGVSSVEGDGVVILSLTAILMKGVVTHEMGHLLLDWKGIDVGPYHIAEFFDRCGLKPWGG